MAAPTVLLTFVFPAREPFAGEIVIRAGELQAELAAGASKPFKEIIMCNIGTLSPLPEHCFAHNAVLCVRECGFTHPAMRFLRPPPPHDFSLGACRWQATLRVSGRGRSPSIARLPSPCPPAPFQHHETGVPVLFPQVLALCIDPSLLEDAIAGGKVNPHAPPVHRRTSP